MASFPPRASFTGMSPRHNLGTPDTTRTGTSQNSSSRGSGLSLNPIMTTTTTTTTNAATTNSASPGEGATSSLLFGRSPLSSLGNKNNLSHQFGVGGLGLRQRKQNHPPSPFFNVGDNTTTIKGPPKASLTMSMGGSHATGGGLMVPPRPPSIKTTSAASPLLLTDTASSSWILVFGFGNQSQCDEVLRKFRAIGTVTDAKMSSGKNKNWLAVQYDSRLAVEKAASEKEFQLSDGCFCGVKKLPDAQSFFLEQRRIFSTVLSNNLLNDSNQETQLFSAPLAADGTNTNNTTSTTAEINEADILMGDIEKQPARGKSCCESFFAWIYGW